MANFPSRQNPGNPYPIELDQRKTPVHRGHGDPTLRAQLDDQKTRRSIRRMKILTAVATTIILIVVIQRFGPHILNHGVRKPPQPTPVSPQPAIAPSSLPIQNEPQKSTQRLLQPEELLTATKEEVLWVIQEPVRDSDLVHTSARAKAGDVDAQYGMGLRFADGHGVPQNYSVAMTWFMKASERGNPEAQLKLALGYMKGIGVPQDEEQAVMWLKRAANNDNSWAQRALSHCTLPVRAFRETTYEHIPGPRSRRN